MTGDTDNGGSISVVKIFFPRKSNFAMAQAAAMPKTQLSGTATAAVRSVNRIAETASGSLSDCQYKCQPLLKALAKTTIKGRKTKNPRKANAIAMSKRRTNADSVRVCIRSSPIVLIIGAGPG